MHHILCSKTTKEHLPLRMNAVLNRVGDENRVSEVGVSVFFLLKF